MSLDMGWCFVRMDYYFCTPISLVMPSGINKFLLIKINLWCYVLWSHVIAPVCSVVIATVVSDENHDQKHLKVEDNCCLVIALDYLE